jgi:flagellar biosynthetic protein FlhB
MILPMLLAAAVAGAVAVLAQTNLLFHMGALQPNFSRVNPLSGLKRVFGTNGGIEVLKSLVKLVLITLFIWISVRKQLPIILHLSFQPTNLLLPIAWMLTYKILIAGLFAHGIIAVADLALVRFRHAQSLRMTKQDVRDEFKDIDGNPHIKARIRRIRVHRWRKRMMAKVPTATVVITNPTHYAVALAYDRANNPAPRIVAKGVDAVAMRIRELARANNVPMVSNPPLARALFRLNLDAEIPAEHYKAVAEVIAYVWRLRRQAGAT